MCYAVLFVKFQVSVDCHTQPGPHGFCLDNVHLCHGKNICNVNTSLHNKKQPQDNTRIITFYWEDLNRNKITANLKTKYHWWNAKTPNCMLQPIIPYQLGDHLESEPGVSLQTFFISVPIVVQDLCPSHHVWLGDQDELGGVAQHEHLGHTVRGHSAVVHRSAKMTAFTCSINTILLPLCLT